MEVETPQTPLPDNEATPLESNGGEAQQTLTQAEVDRLIGRTRKEARDKARAELLKAFGVEDEKAVQDAIEFARAAREAQMTELERARAEAKALADQLAERERALEAERTARLAEQRQQRLASELTAAGVTNPQDAIAIAQVAGIDFESAFDDENKLSKSALDKHIATLRKNKPFLFSSTQISPSNAAGTPPGGVGNNKDMLEQVRRQILKNRL